MQIVLLCKDEGNNSLGECCLSSPRVKEMFTSKGKKKKTKGEVGVNKLKR